MTANTTSADTFLDEDIFSDTDEGLSFDIFSGDWVSDNLDMHEKFGVDVAVENLDKEKLKKFVEFRLNFLEEELNEAKDALASGQPEDAEHIVDAMIDLCVVAIGTLNALQVDTYTAWDRVHNANMAKQVGIKESRPNPLGLPDLIKPEGWVAPSHADNTGILHRIYE